MVTQQDEVQDSVAVDTPVVDSPVAESLAPEAPAPDTIAAQLPLVDEGPVAQPVAPEAPVARPAPPTPSVEASRIEALEAQVTSYQEQQTAQQEQQATLHFTQESTQVQQYYQEQGLDEQAAAQAAQQHYANRMQAWNSYKAQNQLGTMYEKRFGNALELAERYGVSPKELLKINSPEDMERFARQEARLRKLEKGETAARRAQVPPQTFERGAGGGTMSGDDLERGIGNGTVPMTASNLKRLEDFYKSEGLRTG